MAKTSLIISSTDQFGKGLQKTVTDVNPDATSAQLVQFATKLNALTTNVYGRTDRVDKTNCDTEASGKQTPTFTVFNGATSQEITNGSEVTLAISSRLNINYSGDSDIFFNYAPGDGNFAISRSQTPTAGYTFSYQFSGGASGPFVITILAPESQNYQAAEISFTATFSS